MSAAPADADERRRLRAAVLDRLGAGEAVRDELLAYNDPAFDVDGAPPPDSLPLADEPHVAVWAEYAAGVNGPFQALQEALVQLRFPVRAGISELPAYRAVTLSGDPPELSGLATGLQLRHPDEVRLDIVATPGGRLPVITGCGRADFVALLQALAYKNEPATIADSQGAATVAGLNNWDRIERYRRAWRGAHPEGDWDEEFHHVIARRELYKDRFMILSDGPYSSVPAERLGLAEERWRELSVTIRMHHECTHYATSRLFGSMRNRALDELIADYFGISAAIGNFRDDWALLFLGLESFPDYREGGRLQNYRAELSDDGFGVLQRLVRDAVLNLARFDARLSDRDRTPSGQANVLLALASFSIEELAARGADDTLAERHRRRTAESPSHA